MKNGKYCSADVLGINCDRGSVQGWERFIFTVDDRGFGVLKAEEKGICTILIGAALVCEDNSYDDGDKLLIIHNPDQTVSFKHASTNQYCTADFISVNCNKPVIGTWEKFVVSLIN
jgi:hypothetical protein